MLYKELLEILDEMSVIDLERPVIIESELIGDTKDVNLMRNHLQLLHTSNN